MESKPYERFLYAKDRLFFQGDENDLLYQIDHRDKWEAVLEALIDYRMNKVPLPQEISFLLETELSYWVSGVPSPELPLLTRRGRRISPAVRSCQLVAVMYLVAARELGGDHRFRQTVRGHFGISESTLQNWKNKFHDEACLAFAKFRKDMDREVRMRGIMVLLAAEARKYRSLIKKQKPKRRS